MKKLIESFLSMIAPVEQPELLDYDSIKFKPAQDECFIPSAILLRIIKNPGQYTDICKFA